MEALITLGAVALMFLLPFYVLGGRRDRSGRVKIRYGPSRSVLVLTGLMRLLFRLPAYAVIYWYVSLPLIGIATLIYAGYALFGE
jgi:hypothetical protein